MDYWESKANTLQESLARAEEEILELRRQLNSRNREGPAPRPTDAYDTLTETVQGLLDQAKTLKPVISGAVNTILDNIRQVRDSNDTTRTDHR